MTGAVAVYDIIAEGQLVYVGISSRPDARSMAHKASGNMPEMYELMVVEWYNSRAEALKAEAERIKKFKPPLNSVHAVRRCDLHKVAERRERIKKQTLYAFMERKEAESKAFNDKLEAELIEFCTKLKTDGFSMDEIHKRCGSYLLREDVESWANGKRVVR
jgi:predicted GIY-YIG superfamily endonuclease